MKVNITNQDQHPDYQVPSNDYSSIQVQTTPTKNVDDFEVPQFISRPTQTEGETVGPDPVGPAVTTPGSVSKT